MSDTHPQDIRLALAAVIDPARPAVASGVEIADEILDQFIVTPRRSYGAWSKRHPSVQHFEELFKFDHLSEGTHKEVSKVCAALAHAMLGHLSDGPELTVGLRKLWEAKNSFVVQAARFSCVQVPPNPGS